MELTGRQKEFLERFLDLYHQSDEPQHYAAVAEHLGVSPVTAYEMLRLLEEKGLVKSAYSLPPGRSAGRSLVVFQPTEAATELFAGLAGADWQKADWQEVRERILEALEAAKEGPHEGLVREMLARLDEQRPPKGAEAVGAGVAAWTVDRLRRGMVTRGIGETLQGLSGPEQLELAVLLGLVALVAVRQVSPHLREQMGEQIGSIEKQLAALTAERRQSLVRYAQEAWEIIES